MKKILLLATVLCSQIIISQNQKHDLVFKIVNIVSMENDKVLENQNIAISNGKIVAIENAKKSKLKAEKTIDLKGKYIMPSLADAHVHLPETEEELHEIGDVSIGGVDRIMKSPTKKFVDASQQLFPGVILLRFFKHFFVLTLIIF